jgi:DNA-binding response OmpR family regulator
MSGELIAILDDEVMIRAALGNALEDAGFRSVSFSSATEFETNVARLRPQLCVIDLGLPDRNGLALLSTVAHQLGIPVIIISGRASTRDKINGLELGADDYLVKPFDFDELVARIKAVLRRARQGPSAQFRSARINGWQIDFDSLTIQRDGETRSLSLSEVEILQVFLRAPGRLLSREQILSSLGQHEAEAYDRAIDVRISRLRAKFESDRARPIIKTVYGGGYIFVGQDLAEGGGPGSLRAGP